MAAPDPNAKIAAKIRSKHPSLPMDAVDAASRGIGMLTGFHDSLRMLGERLAPGERVHALVQGDVAVANRNVGIGLLAVTDERVLITTTGVTRGLTVESGIEILSINAISNIDVTNKISMADVVLQTADQSVSVKVGMRHAEWVAETIRERASTAPPSGDLGSGFWLEVEYLAGVGAPLSAGMTLSFGVLERGLVLSRAGVYLPLPYERIVDVAAGGPGAYETGGGFIGGGFGMEGAVMGMAIATALNALTTRTKVETIISVVYDEGELHFLSRMVTPEKLDLDLSVARSAIRRTRRVDTPVAPSPAVDVTARLVELAALKEKGLLDDAEFASLKAKLLA